MVSECVTWMMVVPSEFSLFEELHDFLGLAGMEVAGRFVGQDEFWFGDDCACDADQLLLAAGELARVKVLFADDREAIEGIGDERGAFRFAVASIGERDVEVLVNRQVIEQIVVLENETDLLVTQGGALFWFEAMDGGFIEVIFAGPTEVVHA